MPTASTTIIDDKEKLECGACHHLRVQTNVCPP